jgi:hypothetical protein
MRNGLVVIFTLSLALLTGCATVKQESIKLNSDSMPMNSKIGILVSYPTVMELNFPGADCLLCLGVAIAAHGELRDHAKTLTVNDMSELQSRIERRLRSKGYSSVVMRGMPKIDDLPKNPKSGAGFSQKDLSSFGKEGVTHVFVLHVKDMGLRRNYQEYFPAGEPKARIFADVYIASVSDGRYQYFKEYDLNKASVQPWDAPPKFPGLTNAYYGLIEEFKDLLTRDL